MDEEDIYLGPECNAKEIWVYCQRLMHAICKENDIEFIGILEPTMLSGQYNMTDMDSELTSNQYISESITKHLRFIEDVGAIIDKIPYIYNFTDIFDYKNDCFIDWRHSNEKGNQIIADEIFKIIVPRIVSD